MTKAESEKCSEQHSLVGNMAFHIEAAHLEVDDILYVGSVMVLCEVATRILVQATRELGLDWIE